MISRLVALFLLLALSAARLGAEVGAENVLVVVNADSWASRAVANAYLAERPVPSGNVVHLSGLGCRERIEIEDFRAQILAPIRAAIAERGLDEQIAVIAYSSDIPSLVRFGADRPASASEWPQSLRQRVGFGAASTGLTMLTELVEAGDFAYVELDSNPYYRAASYPDALAVVEPSVEQMPVYEGAMERFQAGEHAAAAAALRGLHEDGVVHPIVAYNEACAWALAGELDAAALALRRAVASGFDDAEHLAGDDDLAALRERPVFAESLATIRERVMTSRLSAGYSRALRYRPDADAIAVDLRSPRFLAIQLTSTSGHGLSLAEVREQFARSRAADASHPEGTVYLMRNGNIRSRARAWAFAGVVATIAELGVAAEILDGQLPAGRDDCIGIVAGSASFDWTASGSRILPGAICEHLTSFGGNLRPTGGQTRLVEWLRHGAAGSSGTVVEPLAIQAKFPSPFVQVHYAAGSTLVEAFAQSVAGPYQLLIVGDPLCAPWARPPAFELTGLPSDGSWTEPLVLEVTSADERGLAPVAVYLDGRLHARSADGRIELDPAGIAPGVHELRVVARAADAIGSSARAVHRLTIPGSELTSQAPTEPVAFAAEWVVRAAHPRAARYRLHHQGRVVAEAAAAGDGGVELRVAAAELGLGPSTAVVTAEDAAGAVLARGAPLAVTVQPPALLPALPAPAATAPGAHRLDPDGEAAGASAERPLRGDALREFLGLEAVSVAGWIEVTEPGLHQFQWLGERVRQIHIDDEPPLACAGDSGVHPLALAAGWHRLRIDLGPGDGDTDLRFGQSGTATLDPEGFRHVPE